jgi:hypothetical protein
MLRPTPGIAHCLIYDFAPPVCCPKLTKSRPKLLTDAAFPDLIFEQKSMLKKKLSGVFVLLLVAFAILSAGCSSDTDSGSPQAPGAPIGGSDAPPLYGTQKQSGGA